MNTLSLTIFSGSPHHPAIPQFGQWQESSGSLQADWTDVLLLAAEGRRHVIGNGQGDQDAAE